MTPEQTRERLAAISAELSAYLGVRTHALLAEVIDIVAGMLPADPAPVGEWPVRFFDADGDDVAVSKVSGKPGAVHLAVNGAAYIEADDVDRFIAAVLKAACR
jgi:hypothetical protein